MAGETALVGIVVAVMVAWTVAEVAQVARSAEWLAALMALAQQVAAWELPASPQRCLAHRTQLVTPQIL